MNTNGKGPLIGTIIVIIILVIGAIYFWQRYAEAPSEPESSSDEVSDINADLQSFSTTGLDAELGDIDNEFNNPN